MRLGETVDCRHIGPRGDVLPTASGAPFWNRFFTCKSSDKASVVLCLECRCSCIQLVLMYYTMFVMIVNNFEYPSLISSCYDNECPSTIVDCYVFCIWMWSWVIFSCCKFRVYMFLCSVYMNRIFCCVGSTRRARQRIRVPHTDKRRAPEFRQRHGVRGVSLMNVEKHH